MNVNTVLDAALVEAASREKVRRAAARLWPGKEVCVSSQCPSVTSYVCRVSVEGEELVAKYSWMGLSLVSLLRGAGGSWNEVREAQDEYVRSADSITAREAGALEFLRALGRPRVCETGGLQDGVLFMRPVPGVSLPEVVSARPWETAALLESVLLTLADLHSPVGVARLRGLEIGERSVLGVFRRKFTGPSTSTYLTELGRDRGLPEYERQEIVELLRSTVGRLLRLVTLVPSRRSVVIFGDLKPEHIYVDGPRLHFIDPAVQWASGPEQDLAKLIGRTLLLAIAHPDRAAARQITEGASATLSRYMNTVPDRGRTQTLRTVVALWLMDTVNILSTCLSAPPALVLASHQAALVAQARTIASTVDRASALLLGTMVGPRLLDAVFSEVGHNTGSLR
ncbi:phosphotransferase [Streptomyces sp. NRRL F-5630]|uniref:phosphotransferase n=1 Tax=Streptomyces sp. NRRL F-5630 TaxID=1463864 RepID=UPI003D707CD4